MSTPANSNPANAKSKAGRLDDEGPTPPTISLADIRWQFKADIATKEVQTSPTYSYQWVADQFGHVAIGLLAVLVTWFAGGVLRSFGLNATWQPPVIGFIVLAVAASFWEWRVYQQACAKIEPLFDSTCDRKDLRDNATIATYYMVLGGLVGLLTVLGGNFWPRLQLPVAIAALILIVAGIGLASILPAIYWLRQKIRFQQAGLPFLFRLPEFKLDGLDPAVAKKIDHFIRSSGDRGGRHIAVLGLLSSGKTNLAVGIATEASFNDRKARYLTFDKLQQIVQLPKEPPPPRNTRLWAWQTSQLLVIDDVVSGIPNSAAEHPDQLLKELQDLGEPARLSLLRRNTVWCLGADIDTSDVWIKALKQGSGIADDSLLIVVLQKPSPDATRIRAQVHRASARDW